jgi:hypothetical protein
VPPDEERISRRVWAKRALTLGVVVLVGSGIAGVRTAGYEFPAGKRAASLTAWQYRVLACAASRICAPDEPGADEAPAPSIEEVDLMGWVDMYIGKMDPAIRRDLLRLLGYLEHGQPLRLGYLSRFTSLGPLEQDRVLASLEASDVGLLRGGFSGLKALILMGFYRHPKTWALVGYGGPRLAMPAPIEKGSAP